MSKIEIGTALRTLRGEEVCGDAVRVFRSERQVILALADGMGHGPLAASAATLFCDFVEPRINLGLLDILRGAHAALRGSRGAVAALVRVDADTGELTFAGLGNIAFKTLTRRPLKGFSMPGSLGAHVRMMREFHGHLEDGDIIVLHSDGMSNIGAFDVHERDVDALAEALLERYSTGQDDASCAVLRYRQ